MRQLCSVLLAALTTAACGSQVIIESYDCGEEGFVEDTDHPGDTPSHPPPQWDGALLDVETTYGTFEASFDLTLSQAGDNSGSYPGWCVNPDNPIDTSKQYRVKVYSTTGSVPAAAVVNPENFDLVNYVINTYSLGSDLHAELEDGTPFVTSVHGFYVQEAIWRLIDSSYEPMMFDGVEQAAIDAIMADALVTGEGFVPTCDQRLAVLALQLENLDGDDGNDAQAVIAEVPVVCN